MDESELRAQLEEHHAACYGWALSCCGRDRVEAEDVLQTAYLRVLEGRARYAGRASFKTWLFAVIWRTAADERRRAWLCRLRLARYERVRLGEAREDRAEGPVERSETQAALAAALAQLPGRQQEVLHLVFYQDLSLQEAAEVMGVSLGSVRRHYARGKQRLRNWLERSEQSHE